jgi:acetolactate synthase-1/2/3 large subunit
MFPELPTVDVDELGELPAALESALHIDGPSVISVECSADEIPPFANFLGSAARAAVDKPPIVKEDSDVPARAR